MAFRIAFDLDGTLADMDVELVQQAKTLFGDMKSTNDAAVDGDDDQAAAEASSENASPLEKMSLTPRQQRRLWKHIESIENFWLTLNEIEPGVIRRLATLASERRWEIVFLTKRPQTVGATAQVQTQRWLESKGYRLPSVFVVQRSRGRIADALGLDIVVDDRPENCLDVVVDSKARAILVWREDEKDLPPATRRLGIGVVKSVAECLDLLIKMDTPAGEQRGMMDRVKRLLGLKNAASV
jgi:phosphoglycolate phosphatase-like HAD superfamily hydrolase